VTNAAKGGHAVESIRTGTRVGGPGTKLAGERDLVFEADGTAYLLAKVPVGGESGRAATVKARAVEMSPYAVRGAEVLAEGREYEEAARVLADATDLLDVYAPCHESVRGRHRPRRLRHHHHLLPHSPRRRRTDPPA